MGQTNSTSSHHHKTLSTDETNHNQSKSSSSHRRKSIVNSIKHRYQQSKLQLGRIRPSSQPMATSSNHHQTHSILTTNHTNQQIISNSPTQPITPAPPLHQASEIDSSCSSTCSLHLPHSNQTSEIHSGSSPPSTPTTTHTTIPSLNLNPLDPPSPTRNHLSSTFESEIAIPPTQHLALAQTNLGSMDQSSPLQSSSSFLSPTTGPSTLPSTTDQLTSPTTTDLPPSSPSASLALAGNQPPARRIYVQGMVVSRNVNQISSNSPSNSIHPQPSDPTPQSSLPHYPDSSNYSSTSNPAQNPNFNQPNQPSGSPSGTHPHPADLGHTGSTSLPSTIPPSALFEQAAMISRLLTAAAAATASSLLPYAIHADGSSVQNPTHPSDLSQRTPPPQSSPISITSNSAGGSHQASSTHNLLDTEQHDSDQPSRSGLQFALRDALQAAFGGALVQNDSELSSPQAGVSSTSDPNIPSPVLSTSNGFSISPPHSPSARLQVPPLTQANHNASLSDQVTPVGPRYQTTETGLFGSTQSVPVEGNYSEFPQLFSSSEPSNVASSHQASDQSEQEALPSLPSDSRNVNNTHAGGFERFLRDLQTDVGQAILMALGARPPAGIVESPEEIEERVQFANALPFWEEDEEMGMEGEENPETAGDNANFNREDQPDPSLPFSFFRMHRFDEIQAPEDTRTSPLITTDGTTANSSVNPARSPTGSNISNLIPVLLVGVRSAPPNPWIGALERLVRQTPTAGQVEQDEDHQPATSSTILTHEDDQTFGFSDLRRLFNTGDEGEEENDDQNEESTGEGNGPSSVGLELGTSDGLNEDATSHRQTQETSDEEHFSTSNPSRPSGNQTSSFLSNPSPPRSWLIFVLAGLYPEFHPIFTAPSLFIPTGMQQRTNNLSEQMGTQPNHDEMELGGEGVGIQAERRGLDHEINNARSLNNSDRTEMMIGATNGSGIDSTRPNGLLNRFRRNRTSNNQQALDEANQNQQSQEDLIEEQLLDYETMIRLAELIGQQTHQFHNNNGLHQLIFNNNPKVNPTLTQTQIDQSPHMRKLKFSELRQLLLTNEALPYPIDGAEYDVDDTQEDTLVLENTTEKCLICLDEYQDSEVVRIMQCKHMFHKHCVDQWLVKSSASCPVCRDPAL